MYTVFSRLNAAGVYLKLGLVEPAFIRNRRLFRSRRLFIKCIFSIGSLFNQEPNFNKNFKKRETMSSPLFHLSESGKLFIKKKKASLTETVIELFSTLRFSVHRLRVVSNFGDGDCGAGFASRLLELSRARVCILPTPQSQSPKLEATRSLSVHETRRKSGIGNCSTENVL